MNKRKLRAFTLLELLISLSILSVIGVLSYTSFVSVRRIVDVNRRNEEAMRNLRGFLDRLDVELSSAIYVRRAKQTLFISKRLEIGGKHTNNLIFTTISPQRYFEIGRREEIIKIEYEVTQNEENSDLFVVTKRIYFHLLTEESVQEPFEFTIREDFSSFIFRFQKNGKWYDSWDTEKMDLLPESVELTFTLGGKSFREYFNVYISET
jgi:type II secretion system protein J